jgi:hypothetical protein
VDFGFAYTTATTAVAAGSSFTLTNFDNVALGSKLVLSGGNIVVNDTGFYQVTFGVRSGATLSSVQLQLNSVASTPQSLHTVSGTMVNLTVVVRIVTKPTTLRIQNVVGGTITPTVLQAGEPTIYMTIVKLSP